LCHQSLREIDEAKAAAKRVLEIDRHSSSGHHARALLIELDTDDPKRQEKLKAFEIICRKNDEVIVANNIALLRAREVRNDPSLVREILLPVVKSKDQEDYYNRTRAAIQLAEQSLDNGRTLNDTEQAYLVGAYQFIFNEGLPGLFNRCHDTLWRNFT